MQIPQRARQALITVLILSFLAPALGAAENGVPELKVALEFRKQEHRLSCEAASLRMVLAYHHVDVTEEQILKKMPFDPAPRTNETWGDPEVGFVGDIDGQMPTTGYGIHWHALARVSSAWKKTKVIENGKIADLVTNLRRHRPIIIWGYDRSSSGAQLRWKSPSGREVLAINGEHTRVVFGFRGKSFAPIGFYVMDPQTGPEFWSREELIRNWNSFGRAGIVLFR